MECDDIRPRIDASLDGELPSGEARAVRQHLETCAACRAEQEALLAIRRSVRRAEYHHAPDALRMRIAAALEREAGQRSAADRPEPRRDARFGWLKQLWRQPGSARPASARPAWQGVAAGRTGGGRVAAFAGLSAVAVAMAVAATLALTPSLRGPNRAELFVDELVGAHVRAQLSGHGIDVISTDQHTVKPWFNGRLDYTPPVVDLAAEGFALAGGRLDYVAHRRVAVLIYRYRLHVIDVYVMPEREASDSGGESGSATLVRDGYALLHWRANGMVWWAVTDAEPNVLASFETALETKLQGAQNTAAGRPASGESM
ncbi:MAG TPA: anti-sigma factor [Trinickia sp.]|uniref:anti-sigma factor family protein n=1 Tax=Trinickia sp. TaxID=2571163 RepID=UPI002F40064A